MSLGVLGQDREVHIAPGGYKLGPVLGTGLCMYLYVCVCVEAGRGSTGTVKHFGS